MSDAPELSASVHRSALLSERRVGTAGFVAVAVALHAGILAAALLLPKILQSEVSIKKPVIARLVAMGKPRQKGMLPRKETPPPPGGKVAPASTPSSKPSPSSSRSRAPVKPPPRKQPSRQELMQRALARIEGQSEVARPSDERTVPDLEREGVPEGSPQGTASTAEAGDKYFSEVHDAILQNYVLPSVISERERLYLTAKLVAFIGPDGSLLRHQLVKSSGNQLFDEALEQALTRTKLPAPPRELAQSLQNDGVELNFKP